MRSLHTGLRRLTGLPLRPVFFKYFMLKIIWGPGQTCSFLFPCLGILPTGDAAAETALTTAGWGILHPWVLRNLWNKRSPWPSLYRP